MQRQVNVNYSKLELLGILYPPKMEVLNKAITEVGIIIDIVDFSTAIINYIEKNNLLEESILFNGLGVADRLPDFITELTTIISYLDVNANYNKTSYEHELALLFEMLTARGSNILNEIGLRLDSSIYKNYADTNIKYEQKMHLKSAIISLEERIENNFKTILRNKTLVNRLTCSKMMRENANTFSNLSIQGDLRLLLDKSVTEGRELFGVVHQLKMTYLVDGQLKEIFLALDDVDLDHIINTLKNYKDKNNQFINGIKENIDLVKF